MPPSWRRSCKNALAQLLLCLELLLIADVVNAGALSWPEKHSEYGSRKDLDMGGLGFSRNSRVLWERTPLESLAQQSIAQKDAAQAEYMATFPGLMPSSGSKNTAITTSRFSIMIFTSATAMGSMLAVSVLCRARPLALQNYTCKRCLSQVWLTQCYLSLRGPLECPWLNWFRVL